MSRNGHNLISLSVAMAGALLIGGESVRQGLPVAVQAIVQWIRITAEAGAIQYVDPPIIAVLFVLGAMAGSRAPDWMEITGFRQGIRISVIPHRTVTHSPWLWAVAWLGLIVYTAVGNATPMSILVHYTAMAFLITATLHVALDLCSPTGIPLGNPLGPKYCLGPLYSTGRLSEARVVAPVVLAVFIVYQSVQTVVGRY